jgi:ABC-type lipoprotein release transport system permease subunit
VRATIIGMVITVGAGFFPALEASRVNPVEIFRKIKKLSNEEVVKF